MHRGKISVPCYRSCLPCSVREDRFWC